MRKAFTRVNKFNGFIYVFAGCLGVHCVFTGKAIHLFLFQIKPFACENLYYVTLLRMLVYPITIL